jgi:hypothetical protein
MLVWLGVGPDAEGKDFVYPVFWVIIFIIFTQDWFASRKAIWAKVLLSWDMDKLEVEELDSSNPSVHCSIWLDIWVVQHAFNEQGIHFYNEVSKANNMNSKHTKGLK